MVCRTQACNSVRRRLLGGGLPFLAMVGAASAFGGIHKAQALNLYSAPVGGQVLEIDLNTSVEYSNIIRVNSPSKVLTGSINGNDGDLNLQHGLVDNTFDVLPVLNIKYGNFGAHFSGEAYLNTPYLNGTQNNSPDTYNPASVTNNHYTSATRNVNGLNAYMLDAYVYGQHYFGAQGEQSLTVKVGRQTLLWGQSLYFANNGIAAGQSPIDVIKARQLINPQSQQVFLPVAQAVVTYSPSPNISFQGYYQFQWQPDMLEGVGSYFSTTDILNKGGERVIAVAPNSLYPGSGGYYLYRQKDLTPPSNNGQFGLSVQGTVGQFDLGLYGLRYDDKAPEGIYIGAPNPSNGPGNVGSYWLVYPRNIQVYGASFSTTYAGVNIAGEVSGRRNMPLVSTAAPYTAYPGSANANALYPVGGTGAFQLSEIYVSPGLPLDPGGVTVTSEFAMNHVFGVSANKALLEPGRSSTAGAYQIVVTPAYYDVLPSLNLQFPVGLEYNMFGRSQVDSTMNNGTGFVNVGVTATYRTTWIASLTYQDYFGKPDPTLNPLADRGFVAFSIQHTF